MNPVLKGLYADPDIIKVEDTYYIYPTSDGYDGWGGYQFYVFASKDLINWENKGKILDFHEGDVPWAGECAWAPCTLSKNGKFYFFFCGKGDDGTSAIGVAEAESPIGPFKAKEKPLVTIDMVRSKGIENFWQAIDPSVYTEGDKSYLLFGNGLPVIVELNDDCISIKEDTMRKIEGAYDFREAVAVLKKGELYHFTWSCDDTGSENYHINYGVSKSLFGPIEYKYPVLEKNPKLNILGTGHHSILKDGENYYIAYHRFGTPLEKYPEGKGFHRETCIDKLTFSNDGYMERVTVTN